MSKLPNPIFINESDGSAYIYETLNLTSSPGVAVETAVTEARRGRPAGKRLLTDIAAIHEGITKNFTEYPIEALEASIPSWTAPYNKPIVTNHGRAEGLFGRGYPVEDILGRILKVTSAEHAGKQCLIFSTVVNDPEAIERVRDGRYSTVSIGARIGSAVCSICDNDYAKGTYCEHERGKYYLTDEEDPDSSKRCTWIIGGMEGIEVSFVTMPADQNAGVISAREDEDGSDKDGATEAEMHFFLVDNESIEEVSESGDLVTIAESEHATRLLTMIESASAPIPEHKKEDDSVAETETTPVEEAEVVETEVDTSVETEEEVATDETDGSGDEPEAGDEETPAEPAAEDADEVDPEAAGDESEADAEEPEAAQEEPEAEENEDIANKFEETCTKYHNTLVTLYVERGLSDGSLTGEAEDLAAEYAESSIEDLEALLSKETEATKVSPEDILAVEGIAAESEEAPLATGKDAEANADSVSDNTKSNTEKVVRGVALTTDEGETFIIRAKARR